MIPALSVAATTTPLISDNNQQRICLYKDVIGIRIPVNTLWHRETELSM